jgi:hypothetical protein
MNDPRYPIGKFQPPLAFDPALRAACIQQIEEAPARLRDAVRGLSEPRLDHPYREGGWTVRQVVHHLPDSHMNSYRHPELGTVSLDQSLALYAWHGRHHVAHITTLRDRMGWW